MIHAIGEAHDELSVPRTIEIDEDNSEQKPEKRLAELFRNRLYYNLLREPMDDNPFKKLAKKISAAETERLRMEKEKTEQLQKKFDTYNDMVIKTLNQLKDGFVWDGEVTGSRPADIHSNPMWVLRFNKKGMYKPEVGDNFFMSVFISEPSEYLYSTDQQSKFYFSAGDSMIVNDLMTAGMYLHGTLHTGYDKSSGPWELNEASLINGLQAFVERVVRTFKLF